MTLYPGDIIASGTPAGIGPILDGDVIDVIIERVGHAPGRVSRRRARFLRPTLGAELRAHATTTAPSLRR